MRELFIACLVSLSIIIWEKASEVFCYKEGFDYTPFINAELIMVVFSIISWNLLFAVFVPAIVLFFIACWSIFKYVKSLIEKINKLVEQFLNTKILDI